MLKKSIVLIVMIIAVGFAQIAMTPARAVPKLLNYQGYLTDTLGIPLDDSLDMTFKIFDAATVGNKLWAETQNNVPVERGVFSVLLGNTTSIPDTIFTKSTDRWLETTVETQTLSPRIRITSAAYAYTATYADTAQYSVYGVADDDWTRGTPDSVLFTTRYLGIARKGTDNVLYGTQAHTHVNLGAEACTTGLPDYSDMYSTISGGIGHRTIGRSSTVCGGESNAARDSFGIVCGGRSNSISLGVMSVIVGGDANTIYATLGGIVSGRNNQAGNGATDTCAVIVGGRDNMVYSKYSHICNGFADTCAGYFSFIGNGVNNRAGDALTDTAAIVVGGYDGSALHKYCFVGGGIANSARRDYATVVGGHADTVVSAYGAILGGLRNKAGDQTADSAAVVVGGKYNTVRGKFAFIGGGYDHSADSAYTTIAGGYSNDAGGRYSTIAGGRQNNTNGYYSTIGGGGYNNVSAQYATIAGGHDNAATYDYATVGGGRDNQATYSDATVAGGEYNLALDSHSFIGGGYGNTASSSHATVAGGAQNRAANTYASVGGGWSNRAASWCGTVAGGNADTVNANYGFATNYSTRVGSGHTNSAAFTTSHTTASNQVRAAAFSTGTLAFTMDHPTQPMDKILNQYAVGSSELMLMYSGTVFLDDDGRADVALPEYFDEINRNPRIQLTGVGTSDVFVAEKIVGNHFAVGGKPGTEVYWTVVAERKDPHAEVARVLTPVEQLKTDELVNHSIDDDVLIGIYDKLVRLGHGDKFAFKTGESRRVHEQSIQVPSDEGSEE